MNDDEFATRLAERINAVMDQAEAAAAPPAGTELSNRRMLLLGAVMLVLAVWVPASCLRRWSRMRPRPPETSPPGDTDPERDAANAAELFHT